MGNKNFENDDALDFAGDVEEEGKEKLRETILSISTVGDAEYLEAPEASACLAAIEYFAAAQGNASEDFPEDAAEWLQENTPLPFIEVAAIKKALSRIKSNSELKELWEESGELDEWIAVINDLENRIK